MSDLEFMVVDERIVAGAELDTSGRCKESNDGLYILRAKTFVVVKAMFCIKDIYDDSQAVEIIWIWI